MNVRTSGLSLATGLVSFLVVAAAVTELLSAHVWSSAVVGLPVGVLAGVVAFFVTYYVALPPGQQ